MPSALGVNPKAVEARQRKATAREEQRENERKRVEDAKWRDEITEIKLAKKAELGVKQQEKMQRKAELKALSEKEEAQFTSNKQDKERPSKLTRAEIQQRALLAASMKKKEVEAQELKIKDSFELENPNRWEAEEQRLAREKGQEYIIASSPEEFIDKMSGADGIDRFPTKRMKAAYSAYELEWLERLKQEYPSLKRSQLKEKIWKQWQKAPENPLNQTQSPLNQT